MLKLIIMLLCLTVIFAALLMSVSTLFTICGDIVNSDTEEDYDL